MQIRNLDLLKYTQYTQKYIECPGIRFYVKKRTKKKEYNFFIEAFIFEKIEFP